MLMYDIHSHLGKTSSGDENTPKKLIEDLKKYGVTKVGISCLSGASTEYQNNLVHRAMKEHPGVIYGYGFIHPKEPDPVSEVHRCLGDLKMNGIKLHSWKHGYYPDNTPALILIFDAVSLYRDVHVQMHVGTAPFSTPYTWVEYAKRFPGIKFLFTHTGYYEFGLSTIEAVKDTKNVWVETSGQMDVEVLRRSVEILGAERVCFGTDWPYKPINVEIEKFYELGFSEKELEHIFYKNAAYLWGL